MGVGHNTDWYGFAESFRRHLGDAGRDRIVQLGAGGGGAAVAHALLTADGGVTRSSTRTRGVPNSSRRGCTRFGPGRAETCEDASRALAAADGVVNATPVGMASHSGMPLSPHALRPELWAADITYFPLETLLLGEAR